MYSTFERAHLFMLKAYKGKKFKYTNIEKSFHAVSVALMIRETTTIDDYITAALLHNIITDTDYGYEEIEEQFGTIVADIVNDVTEDMSIAKWFERKKDFMKRIKKENDVNILNIITADRIHNLLMLYEDYKKYGDKLWKSIGRTKEENAYVYRGTYHIVKEKNINPYLLRRYGILIKDFFGDIDDEDV